MLGFVWELCKARIGPYLSRLTPDWGSGFNLWNMKVSLLHVFTAKNQGILLENALFRPSKGKKRKTRQCNGEKKKPAEQLEIAEKEKTVEEAQSVIISDTFKQHGNINVENLENQMLEEGKEDQTGKDERERQNTNQEEQ